MALRKYAEKEALHLILTSRDDEFVHTDEVNITFVV